MLDTREDERLRRKEQRERANRIKVRDTENSLQIFYTIVGCVFAGAIILYFGLKLASHLEAQWQAPYAEALSGESLEIKAPGFQVTLLGKSNGSYSAYHLNPSRLKVVLEKDDVTLKIHVARQDNDKQRARISTLLIRNDVEFRSPKPKEIKLDKSGQATFTVTVTASMDEVTIE